MLKTINRLTSHQSKSPQWIIPISNWSIWRESSENANLPTLKFVDPALRRKLNSLTKTSLKVAHDCAEKIPNIRIVYASQHGDLARTSEMLSDLAKNQELSPTTFSMSVLNALPGVYSIIKQDTSPSIAISAAESSFGFGLLEACLQLINDPNTPVLFIYADEPVPEIFREKANKNQESLAIAILLHSDSKTKISCETSSIDDNISNSSLQIDAFLECLKNEKTTEWQGNGRNWKWCRHEV